MDQVCQPDRHGSKVTPSAGFVKAGMEFDNLYAGTTLLLSIRVSGIGMVMEMEGGFAAWKAAELDIEREPVNRLKKVADRLVHRRH